MKPRHLIARALAAAAIGLALAPVPSALATDASATVPTDDIAADSGAAVFGFDTSREKTESAALGNADVLNSWVGVTPVELAAETNYPSYYDSVTQRRLVYDLTSVGANKLQDGGNAPLLTDSKTVGTQPSQVYDLTKVPIDLNHDGNDEIATVFYDRSFLGYRITGKLSNRQTDADLGLAKSQRYIAFDDLEYETDYIVRNEGMDNRSLFYLYGNDTYSFSHPNSSGVEALTFVKGNFARAASGDVDGNGYDDLVIASYSWKGPRLWVIFFGWVPDDGSAVASDYRAVKRGSDDTYAVNEQGERMKLVSWDTTLAIPLAHPENGYNGANPIGLAVSDMNSDGRAEIYLTIQEGMAYPGLDYGPSLMQVEASDAGTLKLTRSGTAHEATSSALNITSRADDWSFPGANGIAYGVNFAVGDVDGDGYDELAVAGYTRFWGNAAGIAYSDAYGNYMFGRAEAYGSFIAYLERRGDAVDFSSSYGTLTQQLETLPYTIDKGYYDSSETEWDFNAHQKPLHAHGAVVSPTKGGTANWVVPMAAGNVLGAVDGKVSDQVAAIGISESDAVLYQLVNGTFSPVYFKGSEQFSSPHYVESPFIAALTIAPFEDAVPNAEDDTKIYTDREAAPRETLSVVQLSAANDGYDGIRGGVTGKMKWTYRRLDAKLTNWSQDRYGNTTYTFTTGSNEIFEDGNNSIMDEKGLTACYGNFDFSHNDRDSLFLKLVYHSFTYTEPTIEMYVQSPPYFQDIRNVESYNPGTTTFTHSTTSGTNTGHTVSVGESISVGVGVPDKLVEKVPALKFLPNIGFSFNISGSNALTTSVTRTTSIGVSAMQGEDLVVIGAIPTDFYAYALRRPGEVGWLDTVVVKVPSSPARINMNAETYDQYATKYNAYVDRVNAENEAANFWQRLRKLPMSAELTGQHTPGDPATYNQPLSGLDTSMFTTTDQAITLPYSKVFAASSQTLTCAWAKSEGQSSNHVYSYTEKVSKNSKFWSMFSADVSSNETITNTSGTSEGEGTSYSGVINSVKEEYEDFRMNLTMYAGTLNPSRNDHTRQNTDVVSVGYYTSDVHKGKAGPEGLRTVETTKDSATVEATLPFGRSNAAKRYVLLRREGALWKEVHAFTYDVVPGMPSSVALTFTDTGLAPGVTYVYRVQQGDVPQDNSAYKECTATTVDRQSFTLTFPATKGYVDPDGNYVIRELARAQVVDTDGSTTWVTSPAKVLEGDDVRVVALLAVDCSFSSWRVFEDGKEFSQTSGKWSSTHVKLNGTTYYVCTVKDVVGDVEVRMDGLSGQGVTMTEERQARLHELLAGAFPQVGGAHDELTPGWNHVGDDADGNALWQYTDDDGSVHVGWLFDDGSWYYLDPAHDNCMTRGWAHDGTGWFLFGPSGRMLVGWAWSGGSCYYLNEAHDGHFGRMLRDTVVDGYVLGPDGAWVA